VLLKTYTVWTYSRLALCKLDNIVPAKCKLDNIAQKPRLTIKPPRSKKSLRAGSHARPRAQAAARAGGRALRAAGPQPKAGWALQSSLVLGSWHRRGWLDTLALDPHGFGAPLPPHSLPHPAALPSAAAVRVLAGPGATGEGRGGVEACGVSWRGGEEETRKPPLRIREPLVLS